MGAGMAARRPKIGRGLGGRVTDTEHGSVIVVGPGFGAVVAEGLQVRSGAGVAEAGKESGEDGGMLQAAEGADRALAKRELGPLLEDVNQGEDVAGMGDSADGSRGDFGIWMVEEREPGGVSAFGAEDGFKTVGGGEDGPCVDILK